jgi:hypothetical protein
MPNTHQANRARLFASQRRLQKVQGPGGARMSSISAVDIISALGEQTPQEFQLRMEEMEVNTYYQSDSADHHYHTLSIPLWLLRAGDRG